MADNKKIGWIGTGRMGYPMVERLLKAGHDVAIWNRTRAKAEPLTKLGGKMVDNLLELKEVDVLFSIVSTGKDLDQVYFGRNSVSGHGGKIPKIFVDCSTIAVDESAAIRDRLKQLGSEFVAAPVSGNAKVIKGGRLSAVISGSEAACKSVTPMLSAIAPQGVSYVGEGELARVCKIAHNVMLGVVIENLIEITLLCNKMGVPRHAFLAFLNNSAMGSMFTRYKSPALVNLDWTTTFTPELLRKDLDLGLELGREYDVPMPVTAAAREVLQTHFGLAMLKDDPEKYLSEDFAAMMESMALAAGMPLKPENKTVINPDARTTQNLGREREGSGIVIDDNGLVLTIGYLMVEAHAAEVITNDGRTLPANIVGYDHETGFGLLQAIAPLKVKPIAFEKSSALDKDDVVIVASFGGAGRAAPARIVAKREFAGSWEYLLEEAIFTSPPHPAWSGAALISREGKLVGVGSLIVGDPMGDGSGEAGNMFVPIDLLAPILGDLIADGRAARDPRPWIGVTTNEIAGRLVVSQVTAQGPAEKAGLRRGDIIIGVGGTPTKSLPDLYRKIWAQGVAGAT